MEQKTLAISKRDTLRKSASKKLRAQGLIPAVIYGGKQNANITINAREFNKKFKVISESTMINLEGEGLKFNALIKDYQENVMRGEVTHIDFVEVVAGQMLKTHIPIHLTGSAIGVREGGLLEQPIHELEIECLPKDLPHDITIDISEIKIGGSIHLSEVALPKGVKALTNPETVIVSVAGVKAEVVATEDEEAVATEEAAE
jgi:large subunit ribosomal protein L25